MEQKKILHDVSILWRGKKFIVSVCLGATLKDLGLELQSLTNVKADTVRFIVPQPSNKGSKLLHPFSDEHSSLSLQEASILEGKAIRMMGVSEDEVDEVLRNTKANLRIAGFEEEEKRLRRRALDGSSTLPKLPQGTYIFCDFRTLQIPGVELDPPASEALKRMHMLAADPGIIAIMNKYHWRVGVMTEMAPVGYVGVSPKCILGFNKDHGEEISLRLRTDDLKGFRKYESIKKTLLHELAHMVHSEHDANFYALDKQLNQEAVSLDWTKSRSHTLSGDRHTTSHDGEWITGNSSINSFSQKLGGNTSTTLAIRASSVAAAYSRLAKAPINSSGPSEVHKESGPDDKFETKEKYLVPSKQDLGFSKVEPDPDDSQAMETSNNLVLSKQDLGISKVEPDPDDSQATSVENRIQLIKSVNEPDPDDSQAMETSEENGIQLIKTVNEPDPDDSQAMETSVENRFQLIKTMNEPDTGDSQAMETYVENQIQLIKTLNEPDPDDSQAMEISVENGVQLIKIVNEPDPDDCQAMETSVENGIQLIKTVDEPDPDDFQAIRLKITMENGAQLRNTVNEPDPDDSQVRALKISMENETQLRNTVNEPDPDDSEAMETTMKRELQLTKPVDEPDPDDSFETGTTEDQTPSSKQASTEPAPDDLELRRIQDSVTVVCSRLRKAIQMLRREVNPSELQSVLQTLFRIIRNVAEHPDEMKYKRLRKANPVFQRHVVNYKAAMQVLLLIGFSEDIVLDEIGNVETYLILKRNDPGLLWLAKSSIETGIASH